MALNYLYDLLNEQGVIYNYGFLFEDYYPTELSIGNRYNQQIIHTSDGMAYYSKYIKKGK